MLSANVINRFCVLLAVIFYCTNLQSQENSPFSRYGLGDVYPSQNIGSRAMGGISAAYQPSQWINSVNPATYSSLRFLDLGNGIKGGRVVYEIGTTIDTRGLHSATPSDKFNSVNFIPSYVQIGVPLSNNLKSSTGLVFGLRPATKVSYSVQENKRSFDSMQTIYEGNGGLNQAFIGLGKRIGNFSFGVNAGYEFGQKNISTKIDFLNDSVLYYRSNSSDSTSFGGFFINPGIYSAFKLKQVNNPTTKIPETYFLSIGASGTLQQHLNATKSVNRQTFTYGTSGEFIQIDSVYKLADIKGKIEMPLSYTAGFRFYKMMGAESPRVIPVTKWSFGADYTATKWTDYRFFDQPDQINDSWRVSAGGEITPDPLNGNTFWSRSTYKVGFYAGKNYINADGNGYNERALTFGTAFNLRKFRSIDNQSTLINTAFEIGKRGTSVNNLTETFFKLSVGLALSDLWFIHRKYD